jgi:hypothetical protein
MQAYLRVVSGPDAGRTFDLIEGVKLVIGRGEKSDTRHADARQKSVGNLIQGSPLPPAIAGMLARASCRDDQLPRVKCG